MFILPNMLIIGYVEGLDHDVQIPTCTFVDPALEEIIEGQLFKKQYSVTQLIPPEYVLRDPAWFWPIPHLFFHGYNRYNPHFTSFCVW